MLTRISLALCLPFFASPISWGQSTLHVFDGDAPGDNFGISASGAGDVNDDGTPDIVVGANLADSNGVDSGRVRVFSGLDGSVLHTFDGDAGDHMGLSVSGGGDVNGDGFDDIIAGSFADDGVSAGRACVFSGFDGGVLHTLDGLSPNDFFGYAVGGAGDVNADGLDDLIVGALNDVDINGDFTGSARVYSGLDGAVLHTFWGATANESYGSSVSGASDVNGDGFDDVVVGAPTGSGTFGRAVVYSGLDGAVLHTFGGDGSSDWLGSAVSGAGDVNGDGFADVIVGAPEPTSGQAGYARVYSGENGAELLTLEGQDAGDRFGNSVSRGGDANGDGIEDLVVGALLSGNGQQSQRGRVYVYSGVNGDLIHVFKGDSGGDLLGASVSFAGDVDGDGFDDLVAGANKDDDGGADAGRAFVFSSCDGIGVNYCSPTVPNSTGLPALILACGTETVADNRVALSARQLPAEKFGYFLVSQTQGFVSQPPGTEGNLCLGGQIGRYTNQVGSSGPQGRLGIDVDLTDLPAGHHAVQPGETWNFQAWFRDNNPTTTSNFTNGIAITFL